MSDFTLILYETGLHLSIPELRKVSAATFPAWGDFSFLDFHLSTFACPELRQCLLVLEGEHRSIQSAINTTKKRDFMDAIPLAGGLENFIEILEKAKADTIILDSLSHLALTSVESIKQAIKRRKDDSIKIAVTGIPLDLYIADRKKLIDTLITFRARFNEWDNFYDFLFNEIMHTTFESMEEIPGEVLFQNSLMQLYRENMRLVKRQKDQAYRDIFNRLSRTASDGQASYVGESGHIKNSLITSGVDIQGYVENSIIFPGVIIGKETSILNSVIMNNNQIGQNAVVKNTMILPYNKELMRGASNIGNETVIGETSSSVKNSSFPDQINSGISVLGVSVEIPRGIIIEPGCYLSGNTTQTVLKNLKKLGRGKSLLGAARTSE